MAEPIFCDATADWLTRLSAWSTFAQALVVIGTLGFAWWQFRVLRSEARIKRTIELLNEFRSSIWEITQHLADDGSTTDSRLVILARAQDVQKRIAFMRIYNFFDHAFQMLEVGAIDWTLYAAQLDSVTLQTYILFEPTIRMFSELTGDPLDNFRKLAVRCQSHYRSRSDSANKDLKSYNLSPKSFEQAKKYSATTKPL